MNALRQGLLIGLLVIGCALGLQVSFLLLQAAQVAAESQLLVADARARMVAASRNLNAILIQLGLASDEWRRASLYSGEISKRTAQLIVNADARAERVTRAFELTAQEAQADLHKIGLAAAAVGKRSDQVGYEAAHLLASGTAAVESLDRLARTPAWEAAAADLARSSANLEKATANTAEATGYIRDMLSPRRRPFWRRLLELLLPRPVAAIRK